MIEYVNPTIVVETGNEDTTSIFLGIDGFRDLFPDKEEDITTNIRLNSEMVIDGVKHRVVDFYTEFRNMPYSVALERGIKIAHHGEGRPHNFVITYVVEPIN
jgi:hypothetical protein